MAIKCDYGAFPPQLDLTPWAKQSKVLLLNTALTVEEGKPRSHLKYWTTFTNRVVKELVASAQPLVFLLWGSYAQGKRDIIDRSVHGSKHHVLEAPHPSSRGDYRRCFLRCSHFSHTNDLLVGWGLDGVDWLMQG